jgi:hypothetical protein
MNYKRFIVVLAITAALTATTMTVGGNYKAFADLPNQASGSASDPGQGGVNGQAPSQAGGGGFCPPDRGGPPCR